MDSAAIEHVGLAERSASPTEIASTSGASRRSAQGRWPSHVLRPCRMRRTRTAAVAEAGGGLRPGRGATAYADAGRVGDLPASLPVGAVPDPRVDFGCVPSRTAWQRREAPGEPLRGGDGGVERELTGIGTDDPVGAV